MTKIFIATLLAFTATPALAEPPVIATSVVQTADLDLSTAKGQRALDRRLDSGRQGSVRNRLATAISLARMRSAAAASRRLPACRPSATRASPLPSASPIEVAAR